MVSRIFKLLYISVNFINKRLSLENKMAPTAIAPVAARLAQASAISLDDLALDTTQVNLMRRKGRDMVVYDVKAFAAAEGISIQQARSALLVECNDRFEGPKGFDVGQGPRPENKLSKLAIYHKGLKPDAPSSAYERFVVMQSSQAYFNALLNQS